MPANNPEPSGLATAITQRVLIAAPRLSGGDSLYACVWLLALAITINTLHHVGASVLLYGNDTAPWWENLLSVPWLAWVWGALHVMGALVSFMLGYQLLRWSYPVRDLWQRAALHSAPAIQAGAHLLSAGIIALVCWGGCDPSSWVVSLVFSLLGFVTIIVVNVGHRLVTRYLDHQAILDNNIAVAVASAGLHVAVAIVIGQAMNGTFVNWSASFVGFAQAAIWVLLLYPLRQLIVTRIILRLTPARLDQALVEQRSIPYALVEAAAYVITALAVRPA